MTVFFILKYGIALCALFLIRNNPFNFMPLIFLLSCKENLSLETPETPICFSPDLYQ